MGILSDKIFANEYLGQSKNYLAQSRLRSTKDKQYEDYSKYFKLLVNLIMLTESQPKLFKGKKEIFIKEVIDLVYNSLLDSKQIFENVLIKAQIETIAYTLYALTLKRFEDLTEVELDFYKNKNNPKGLVTISDLSKMISETRDHRQLIAEQLIKGRESLQLIEAIDHLKKSSQNTKSACNLAINKIKKYMERGIESASKKKSFNQRKGTYIHPPLELFSIKDLASKGIFVSREVEMFPLKTRADLVMLRDKLFISSIEDKNVKNLPSLAYSGIDRSKIKFVAIDLTMSDHYGDIYDKCLRGYQKEDTYVFVVLYGKRDSKFLNILNTKINNDPSIPYSSNVEVISVENYYKLLGFEKDTIDNFKRVINIRSLKSIIEEYIKAKTELNNIAQQYEGWIYFDRYLKQR